MKQFFFSFPREDLRKWLSYVCRSRDHSLSLTHNQFHSLPSSTALSLLLLLLTTFHAHTNCTECSSFFVSSFLPLSINTGTNSFFLVLFNCLYFTRVFTLPLAVEKCCCQITCCKISNLNRSPIDLRLLLLMSSNSVVVVVVVVVTHLKVVVETRRRLLVSSAAVADSGISTTLRHRSVETPARNLIATRSKLWITHGTRLGPGFAVPPLRDRSNSSSLLALSSLLVTRFFAEKHRHSL